MKNEFISSESKVIILASIVALGTLIIANYIWFDFFSSELLGASTGLKNLLRTYGACVLIYIELYCAVTIFLKNLPEKISSNPFKLQEGLADHLILGLSYSLLILVSSWLVSLLIPKAIILGNFSIIVIMAYKLYSGLIGEFCKEKSKKP